MLEDSTDDHEQGFSHGDAAGLGVECAGLERRRVHAREGYQSALVGEPAHIANLRHKLRPGDLARALHGHDYIEFRVRGRLPKDREKMLARLDKQIEETPEAEVYSYVQGECPALERCDGRSVWQNV